MCYFILVLPILIPSVYYINLSVQIKRAKTVRHLQPIHLKAVISNAVSSAFLIVLGLIYFNNGILVLYVVPGIFFGIGAVYHWFEYKWYRDLDSRID
jgi:hypothetical protein